MRNAFVFALVGLAIAAAPAAPEDPATVDPAVLRAEVEALRAPDVAWRKIPWRTCLLDALAAGRTEGKPLLAWIFIDRPVDDARC